MQYVQQCTKQFAVVGAVASGRVGACASSGQRPVRDSCAAAAPRVIFTQTSPLYTLLDTRGPTPRLHRSASTEDGRRPKQFDDKVTGYVLTSALLLKCPTLLHRRKRETFLSRHISHRGGAGENLENTMAAFKHAVGVGTDMLELDCHLTKDEQVVVSHDASLQRSTGINANISDMTYAELPPYLCKLGVTFQRECFCEGGEDKRIPLLRDIFDAFPKTPVNIDIKTNNDTLIKKVSELVVKYDREHLTVWGNARNQIVKKCYKENPRIPLLFSFPRVLQLLGLFYTGLLPFVPLKEQFLEIPMPSIITKLKDPERLTRSQRFITWLADTLLMRKALFEHLTARGIQVYIWVLNDEEDFQRAFDLGATGVMTDFPTRLKDFMDKNGISKTW